MNFRGLDLAEEAVGFGLPVLKQGLQAIFAGNIELDLSHRDSTWAVTAFYGMNLVEKIARPGTASVRSKNLYALKNYLAAMIRQVPHLRAPLTMLSGVLRRLFGWETIYEVMESCARVKMEYTLDEQNGVLVVEADLADVSPGSISEAIIMNEQGAHAFDQYRDSSGIRLSGKKIGCWDEVTAEEASFASSVYPIAFTLPRLAGARLFRGRELIGSRLAWSGFGYSYPPAAGGLKVLDQLRNPSMTSVLLIYPFFKPRRDRSVFRFPPLGISYIASSLRAAGHSVKVLDCTFVKSRDTALEMASVVKAEVVGIYCMVTMLEDSLWFASQLRQQSRLLVAGGPLPTCDPVPFLEKFDVVVRGEGEQTIIDLLEAHLRGSDLRAVPGIVYRKKPASPGDDEIVYTKKRPFAKDLDRIPFPARDLLPNEQYISHARRKYGYSITTVMSTRGCPYHCEFCSNVVFGGSYRERSPGNVVDEIEEALEMGYERISFADDVFTMKKERVILVCEEILGRGLKVQWECLGRVDSLDAPTALRMKQAGCTRIYFGIESADEDILHLMNKRITPEQAQKAVEVAHAAGLEVGAFFILFYPGDTEDSVLKTLHFATSLPLDYLGLSMPYPLPGTALFERIRGRIKHDWRPVESPFASHVLIFEADFSETRMWFGIIKGHVQFRIKKSLGKLAPIILAPFENITDGLFRLLK